MQRLEDPLIVDPGFDPSRLQPASLELTLAPDFISQGRGGKVTIPGDHIEITNGMFVLGSTVEKVHIPRDLVAQVNGKSSWARKGLIVHTTAGFIDPGFKGTITLEFKNVSKYSIYLPIGAPICQLVFYQMTSPAERPYGSTGLFSHYQGQDGVTPAAR